MVNLRGQAIEVEGGEPISGTEFADFVQNALENANISIEDLNQDELRQALNSLAHNFETGTAESLREQEDLFAELIASNRENALNQTRDTAGRLTRLIRGIDSVDDLLNIQTNDPELNGQVLQERFLQILSGQGINPDQLSPEQLESTFGLLASNIVDPQLELSKQQLQALLDIKDLQDERFDFEIEGESQATGATEAVAILQNQTQSLFVDAFSSALSEISDEDRQTVLGRTDASDTRIQGTVDTLLGDVAGNFREAILEAVEGNDALRDSLLATGTGTIEEIVDDFIRVNQDGFSELFNLFRSTVGEFPSEREILELFRTLIEQTTNTIFRSGTLQTPPTLNDIFDQFIIRADKGFTSLIDNIDLSIDREIATLVQGGSAGGIIFDSRTDDPVLGTGVPQYVENLEDSLTDLGDGFPTVSEELRKFGTTVEFTGEQLREIAAANQEATTSTILPGRSELFLRTYLVESNRQLVTDFFESIGVAQGEDATNREIMAFNEAVDIYTKQLNDAINNLTVAAQQEAQAILDSGLEGEQLIAAYNNLAARVSEQTNRLLLRTEVGARDALRIATGDDELRLTDAQVIEFLRLYSSSLGDELQNIVDNSLNSLDLSPTTRNLSDIIPDLIEGRNDELIVDAVNKNTEATVESGKETVEATEGIAAETETTPVEFINPVTDVLEEYIRTGAELDTNLIGNILALNRDARRDRDLINDNLRKLLLDLADAFEGNLTGNETDELIEKIIDALGLDLQSNEEVRAAVESLREQSTGQAIERTLGPVLDKVIEIIDGTGTLADGFAMVTQEITEEGANQQERVTSLIDRIDLSIDRDLGTFAQAGGTGGVEFDADREGAGGGVELDVPEPDLDAFQEDLAEQRDRALEETAKITRQFLRDEIDAFFDNEIKLGIENLAQDVGGLITDTVAGGFQSATMGAYNLDDALQALRDSGMETRAVFVGLGLAILDSFIASVRGIVEASVVESLLNFGRALVALTNPLTAGTAPNLFAASGTFAAISVVGLTTLAALSAARGAIRLQEGGIIPERAGGSLVNINGVNALAGEGGAAEAVLPLEGPQIQRVGQAVADNVPINTHIQLIMNDGVIADASIRAQNNGRNTIELL